MSAASTRPPRRVLTAGFRALAIPKPGCTGPPRLMLTAGFRTLAIPKPAQA